METKRLRDFEEQSAPEGKACTQPGCDHPAYISVWWAPGHFSGFKCKCCHRRTLERRLKEVAEELERLPAEIAALPTDCEQSIETRADEARDYT
jgi:hypothetical protein